MPEVKVKGERLSQEVYPGLSSQGYHLKKGMTQTGPGQNTELLH